MSFSSGELLNGRYRVEAKLAEGGMGAVYRAFDTLRDRPCALKQFRLAYLPSEEETRLREDEDATRVRGERKTSPVTREKAIEQFRLEAKLLAKLDHPHLPKVFDFFTVGSDWYLAMDYIEGENLATRLDNAEGKPLPEQQVLGWMEQVMDALSYCHQQRVIHRDIKPANVIVTPSDQVYLVDFGIAKAGAGIKTLLASFTSGYSSPEHYDEEAHTDERSDIYALGATMYALLAGHEPVGAIQRMRGKELPSPRSLVSNISPAADAAIVRTMAIRPEDRFQGVEDLRTALRATATQASTRQLQGWVVLPVVLVVGLLVLWAASARSPSQPSTPTPTHTPLPTVTTSEPTGTSTVAPTLTQTPTRKPTVTQVPTLTPTSTRTPTSTSTFTPVPTNTPTPMPTPTSTSTFTPVPTNTPTPTPTSTNTPKPTLTHTPTPTRVPTNTPIPYPPLSVDWTVRGVWCIPDLKYRIEFSVWAEGGNGVYTYYRDEEIIGGPKRGGIIYWLDWGACCDAPGTFKVISGDGQVADKGFYVKHPICR